MATKNYMQCKLQDKDYATIPVLILPFVVQKDQQCFKFICSMNAILVVNYQGSIIYILSRVINIDGHNAI